MQVTKYTRLPAIRLVVCSVILYAAAFFFYPQAFSKAAGQFKMKAVSEAGYEFSETGDSQNEPSSSTHLDFLAALFNASEINIGSKSCSYMAFAFHTLDYRQTSLYHLNCSFLFYG